MAPPGCVKKFWFFGCTGPALQGTDLTCRSANSSQPAAGTDFIWKMRAIYQRYDGIVFTAILGQNRQIADHWIRGQIYDLFKCIYRGKTGSNKAHKLATTWLEDHTGKVKNTTKVRLTDFHLIRSYLSVTKTIYFPHANPYILKVTRQCDALILRAWANCESGEGGGGVGGTYKSFLRRGSTPGEEVEPLTLLYTIFNREGTPFEYLLFTNGTPFEYSGTSSLGHLCSRDTSIHGIQNWVLENFSHNLCICYFY